ncbi:zinc metallopeptidase [Proteiniclasticum sp. SCR006]|uniref:Zinc metallopeptidase n=1 Tax=Proteiniclasticum aestuarii TaxID=2817862 RepID=A0A939KI36_9CLOT|nr:zinc metallopeptidase [Proteiniclasticum aestuarii]MBO1263728.1 zinc metallopeptidase [Proteiniclasticum aestuarii]
MIVPYGLDPTILLLIPAMILSIYAQSKIKSAYNIYSREGLKSGMTGAEVARMVLDRSGLQDVSIERVAGNLTDHYDPRKKVLRLSSDVYGRPTIASAGVAAHEAGHAIQDQVDYGPLKLRSFMVPFASFGSRFSMIIIIIGLIFGFTGMISLGIVLFSLVVLFQLFTLPVEFNASSRALAVLGEYQILTADEVPKAKKVLDAAALTYVAAAFSSIMTLVRLLIIRDRRR